MHNAHIELLCGCIRLFEDGKNYGDEYVFTCTVRWINCEEVEFKGVTNFSPKYRIALCDAVAKYGVKAIRWVRKKNGHYHIVRIDTETYKFYRDKPGEI